MAATFTHDGSFIPDAPDKDESSNIDYGCDWSSWLQDGETITASDWHISPSGIPKGVEDFTVNTTSIFLSEGSNGTIYTLRNRITTNQNRIEDRSMLIECKQK